MTIGKERIEMKMKENKSKSERFELNQNQIQTECKVNQAREKVGLKVLRFC